MQRMTNRDPHPRAPGALALSLKGRGIWKSRDRVNARRRLACSLRSPGVGENPEDITARASQRPRNRGHVHSVAAQTADFAAKHARRALRYRYIETFTAVMTREGFGGGVADEGGKGAFGGCADGDVNANTAIGGDQLFGRIGAEHCHEIIEGSRHLYFRCGAPYPS